MIIDSQYDLVVLGEFHLLASVDGSALSEDDSQAVAQITSYEPFLHSNLAHITSVSSSIVTTTGAPPAV